MAIKLFNLPTGQDHYRLGRIGEEIAAHFLRASGYLPLKKRYRRLGFEVDMIMEKDDTVVAVEVKTRSQRTPTDELLSSRQIWRIRQGLLHFVYNHQLKKPLRIIMVTVFLLKTETYPQVQIYEIM